MSAAPAKSSIPVVATDAHGRITSWSEGATALFGFTSEQALGQPFADLLRTRDVHGNRYCGCGLGAMLAAGERPRTFELLATSASGVAGRFTVTSELAGSTPAGEVSLTLAFRPDRRGNPPRPAAADRGDAAPVRVQTAIAQPHLTDRELEVLRLLAGGAPSKRIATTLRIQVTTARNHVQNVLSKLGAHSRLEAVSRAQQLRLL